MTTTETMIQAAAVSKLFGDRVAVSSATFEVATGTVFGLLGPNGAGKTTTVRMLLGSIPRSGGRLSVLGLDPSSSSRQIRSEVGVVPQADGLDPELSVRQNLMTYGRYFGRFGRDLRIRVEMALHQASLSDRARDPIHELSGGMRRRLTLARALLNSPKVLLLDEPTTALDPVARREVWHSIRGLARTGVTVLLTTHFMDEAEFLCDKVAFISAGLTGDSGSPADFVRNLGGAEVITALGAEEDLRMLAAYSRRHDQLFNSLSRRSANELAWVTDHGAALLSELNSASNPGLTLGRRRSSLDDVYVKIMSG